MSNGNTGAGHSDDFELSYPDSVLDDVPDKTITSVDEIGTALGYESLTPTQEQVIGNGALSPGNKLLVAQTGNGKTFVAECALNRHLKFGRRIAYLVPSKQLRKEKVENLRKWVDSDVDVVSSDTPFKEGDIVVKTFDQFFSGLIHNVPAAVNMDMAVFDDFHELYSDFRGSKIEKCLAMTKHKDIDIFAMSATIGNPEDIADWFDADLYESTEGRCKPLVEQPVNKNNYDRVVDSVVDTLQSNREHAPFLVFNNSKRSCEKRAAEIAQEHVFGPLPSDIQGDIQAGVRQRVDGLPSNREEKLLNCMQQGVAFHHSGLPSRLREYVVDEFRAGNIKAIICTPTLAYGFDADVQSVVVADLQRYDANAGQMTEIGTYEYIQWIGRAARRGTPYDEGQVYPLYGDEDVMTGFQPMKQPSEKDLEPIESKLKNRTEARITFLELIDAGWNTDEKLDEFMAETLYWEQTDRSQRGLPTGDPVVNYREDILQWLEEAAFITEDPVTGVYELTSKGEGTNAFLRGTWYRTNLNLLSSLWNALDRETITTPERATEAIAAIFANDACLNPDRAVGESALFNQKREEDIETTDTDRIVRWVDNLDLAGTASVDSSATAALLIGGWCRDIMGQQFANEFGISKDRVSRVADTHAQIMEGMGALLRHYPDIERPDWWYIYKEQIEHGIRPYVVPAMDIQQVGRARAVSLSVFIDEVAERTSWSPDGDNLLHDLYDFVTEILDGDYTRMGDMLESKADDIGDELSDTIREYLESLDPEDDLSDDIAGIDVDGLIDADVEPDARYTKASNMREELSKKGGGTTQQTLGEY